MMQPWENRARRLLALLEVLLVESDSPSERYVLRQIAVKVHEDLLGEELMIIEGEDDQP